MRHILLMAVLVLGWVSGAWATVDLSANDAYRALLQRYGSMRGPNPPFIIEAHLHPLGWSRNNRFAYILHEPNEAMDFETARLKIHNVITDKTKVAMKWNFENSFAHSIRLNTSDIFGTLKRHKISSGDYHVDATQITHLRSFPIQRTDGTRIVPDLKLAYGTSKTFGSAERFVTRAHLYLQLERHGKRPSRKRVFSAHYKLMDVNYALRVLGYLPSPYTDRIVIVLARVYRGWEGDPHVLDFVLVGASLSKGF